DKLTYAKMGRPLQFSDEEPAVMNDIVINNSSIFLDKLQCKMCESAIEIDKQTLFFQYLVESQCLNMMIRLWIQQLTQQLYEREKF
ncbi:hypothetical protein CROQUDRAFT_41061, partial [Cronartium quercuum f. sp. fusiforme G11]